MGLANKKRQDNRPRGNKSLGGFGHMLTEGEVLDEWYSEISEGVAPVEARVTNVGETVGSRCFASEHIYLRVLVPSI